MRNQIELLDQFTRSRCGGGKLRAAPTASVSEVLAQLAITHRLQLLVEVVPIQTVEWRHVERLCIEAPRPRTCTRLGLGQSPWERHQRVRHVVALVDGVTVNDLLVNVAETYKVDSEKILLTCEFCVLVLDLELMLCTHNDDCLHMYISRECRRLMDPPQEQGACHVCQAEGDP